MSHYRLSDVKAQQPGYASNILIAPLSFFDSIMPPNRDNYYIIGRHTFLATKDYLVCYCLPKSIELPSESTGEQGAETAIWKPKFFIPGDGPEVLALITALMKEELIALFRDPELPDMIQIGTERLPMYLDSATFESGTMFEGRKGYSITAISREKRHFNYDTGIFDTTFDFFFDTPE